jgi:hypothetical protein
MPAHAEMWKVHVIAVDEGWHVLEQITEAFLLFCILFTCASRHPALVHAAHALAALSLCGNHERHTQILQRGAHLQDEAYP